MKPRASISPNHSFDDPAKPKILRDMTDAEIGALVRAQNEGKVIEMLGPDETEDVWVKLRNPRFNSPSSAYRVRPEPKPKTVTIYGHLFGPYTEFFAVRIRRDTHSITFTLREDGTPDCSIPAKIEELTDAD